MNLNNQNGGVNTSQFLHKIYDPLANGTHHIVSNISDTASSIYSHTKTDLTKILNSNIFIACMVILVTIYLTKIQHKVPPYIHNLFRNEIFRIVFLSLLLIYGFKSSPHIALIMAFIFVITIHFIGEQEQYENIAYFEAYQNQISSNVDKQKKEKKVRFQL